MKGADARRVSLLREAAETVGCEAILGLADVRTTHDAWLADEGYGYRRRRYYDEHEDYGDSAEYEINDLINTEVSLTHWTGKAGLGWRRHRCPWTTPRYARHSVRGPGTV